MYKNQLQELAQRSCFNLPSYSCIREGPDHAPRFKAAVNFNGERFESPTFCSTLRQAEHAAAEVALKLLSKQGPSRALAARVLDETGVYKNLLQETVHRAGLKLPAYTTVRSGPGHGPVFSCMVELAGMNFTGEPAKTKKQAQKNAALIAWSALKKQAKSASSSSSGSFPSYFGTDDEQDQVIIARYLATLKVPGTNNSRRECPIIGDSTPIQRDVIPYGDARSLYSLPNQNWLPSYPEISMYQTYPQKRFSQQQEHPLALSSLPSSPRIPQIFPLIRSMFQPYHGYFIPSQGQGPVSIIPEIDSFLYFSNHLMPVPVRNASQVSIQEIEDSPQMEEDWRNGDGGSDFWKRNCSSYVNKLSAAKIPNSMVCLNSHSEQRMQEKLQDKAEAKSISATPNHEISNQLHGGQAEQHRWFSPGFIDAKLRSRTISTDGTKFQLRSTDGLDYLQPKIRPVNPGMVSSSGSVRGTVPPAFAADPVTSTAASTCSLKPKSSLSLRSASPPPPRTAPSVCSGRPWPEGTRNQGAMLSRHYLAPAVHIRSVVPVCSTPPSKQHPGPSRQKRSEEHRSDFSAPSSDFSKLQL